MIVYDEKARRYYDDQTGEWVAPPATDHTQNPLIGVLMLVAFFALVYVMSGSPQIVWVP